MSLFWCIAVGFVNVIYCVVCKVKLVFCIDVTNDSLRTQNINWDFLKIDYFSKYIALTINGIIGREYFAPPVRWRMTNLITV